MGLIATSIYRSPRQGLLAGVALHCLDSYRPSLSAVSFRRTFDNDYLSFPVGYYQNGIIRPMRYGGVSCRLTGGGSLALAIGAVASLGASLDGSGALSVYGYKGINGVVNLVGGGSFTAGIAAKASIYCTITIGAQPSAFDIAQAIWNATATQYNIAGTMGNKLNGAGSAGDPWGTTLPGSYPAGTAGNLLGNQSSGSGLTLPQFIALK